MRLIRAVKANCIAIIANPMNPRATENSSQKLRPAFAVGGYKSRIGKGKRIIPKYIAIQDIPITMGFCISRLFILRSPSNFAGLIKLALALARLFRLHYNLSATSKLNSRELITLKAIAPIKALQIP